MHDLISKKEQDFQSLDPYGDLDQDDKSLTQFRISKKDFIFLRNLGEKRGVLQTCAAILIKGLVEECHRRGIEDYTHLKQFGELVLSYGPDKNTTYTSISTPGTVQPSGGGTSIVTDWETPHITLPYGVKGTDTIVENITSLGSNDEKRTDGRVGPVGDVEKPKRSTSKAKGTGTKPTTKGKTGPK